MKRDRDLESKGSGKAKMWCEEQKDATGVDELLAVLGYKVRSSDMAEVAQKLEQLEMVMGTAQEDGISHLSSDAVHYNPSDMSGWVESMISELNSYPVPNFGPDNSEYDLAAIPGGAICKQKEENGNNNKRLKSRSESEMVDSTRPVVLVDSQEAGVRLVHTLMACAEAVQQDNLKLADALVKHIGILAVSQAGAMRKVATYFAEALARRIYKIYPPEPLDNTLQMHFYETCPYLKFAHFTANQAILEAFSGAKRVHVVDFSLNQGTQWPALIQALAVLPTGPPAFRLTGIGPPVQQIGWRLHQFAESLGVEFEFNSLGDIDEMVDLREGEAVAVNSVFEFHRLLGRPGEIERVLKMIKSMNPKIVTVVEQEATHNGAVFLDRFNEALHYYSAMFDSLEGSGSTPPDNMDVLMSEVYLGRQICNVVACEGPDRVERHETLAQWRMKMGSAGFNPVHLGSNAFKQASLLLALFAGGDGYRVEENNGSLMLGWHTRPLIATSAWQPAP